MASTPSQFKNPLLAGSGAFAPTVVEQRSAVLTRATPKQELRRARGQAEAEAAIAELQPGMEVHIFSSGTVSKVDLCGALLKWTGPARCVVSTWTALAQHVALLAEWRDAGAVLSCRWLIDVQMPTREPGPVAAMHQNFGPQSVALLKNHCKFFLAEGAERSAVMLTSSNFNQNPRAEWWVVSSSPDLVRFVATEVVGQAFADA